LYGYPWAVSTYTNTFHGKQSGEGKGEENSKGRKRGENVKRRYKRK